MIHILSSKYMLNEVKTKFNYCDTRTRHWTGVSRVGHGHATDTRKSVSDTPNKVSNILIFFRTRGHGKDIEGTRQGHVFLKKNKKIENRVLNMRTLEFPLNLVLIFNLSVNLKFLILVWSLHSVLRESEALMKVLLFWLKNLCFISFA